MKKVYRRGKIKKILTAIVFTMALSVGTICSADEGKVTVESAKIRASADASSEQVASVKQGGTVDIISETTGTDGKSWYQVWVNGEEQGYIRADLVERTGGTTTLTNNNNNVAAAAEPAGTTANPTEARRATVKTDGTRIRKGASTSHDVVATANSGMVLTVTGEAAGSDGKTWYQVSFTHNDREITGYIRSDLVTFEEVPPDEAVTNITGTENQGEGEAPPTEETPQENVDEGMQPSNSTQGIIYMNVDEEPPYIMPGFVEAKINIDETGESCKGWSIGEGGQFLIMYAQMPNGDSGWYLVDNRDSSNKVYQRYVYSVDGIDAPSSVNILPIAVLAIVIVILLAVIGLMFMRLREYSGGYDDDDEYDDDDDDDDDELEELEDDDDFTPHPTRRAAANGRPAPQGQPQRRPQPQMSSQGQPQRRPQPQMSSQGQPQRRPQPQMSSQGQPQRRPQPQSEDDMRIRSDGDGRVVTKNNNSRHANGQALNRRPAQGQGQQQQRPKTKINIENEQDDMDFIDI